MNSKRIYRLTTHFREETITIAVIEATSIDQARLIAGFNPWIRNRKVNIVEMKRFPFPEQTPTVHGFKFLQL